MLGQPQQNHFQKEQNCGQVLRWLYGLAVSAVLTEQDVGRGMGGIQSRPLKCFYCGGVSHKTKMTNSAPRESICSPSPAAEWLNFHPVWLTWSLCGAFADPSSGLAGVWRFGTVCGLEWWKETVPWWLFYMSKKEYLLKEIMNLNRVHCGKQFKKSSLDRAENTPLEYAVGVIIFGFGSLSLRSLRNWLLFRFTGQQRFTYSGWAPCCCELR